MCEDCKRLFEALLHILGSVNTSDWDSMSGSSPRSLDGVFGDVVYEMAKAMKDLEEDHVAHAESVHEEP